MILSTVRSSLSSESLGFLKNDKRFNVGITRAQALQIVVGDPKLLASDRTWNHLLQYCISNQAFKGCEIEEQPKNKKKKGRK